MDEDILTSDLVDDAIRLEVDLPVRRYRDAIQLGWDVAAQGQVGEAKTERFQLIHHVVSMGGGIVTRDIGMDVDQVLLGILDDADAVPLHSDRVLTCLRTSAKAFFAGLLRPS